MKKCSQCKEEKELDEFNNDINSKDGKRSNCKACSKVYRERNKEKDKEYRKVNKERFQKRYKEYKEKNYDRISESKRKYYYDNKERILKQRKETYALNSKQKLEYQKEYQKNNKEKRNLQMSLRRKNDPMFKLTINIRNLINNSFYKMGYSKDSRTEEILGCSFGEFKIYLESKFEIWMNWNNRGLYNGELQFGWDIDHIIPLSSAETEEDLVRLSHYLNLQPLCSKVNRDIKKNSINEDNVV